MKNIKTYIVYILAAIFVAYAAFIFSYVLDAKLDLNGDNVHYMQLASNIADGHGYVSVNLDGKTSPTSHFPPGYPAILSIFISLGIDSLMAFKIINGVFLILSILMLAYIVSKITEQRYLAFSIAILTVMSPVLIYFAGIVMSEMSYLFFTMLSVLSLYLYQKNKGDKPFYTSPWFYAAILFAVGAYYIRTVGASIMVAVIVFYLFRKEWLAAISSAAIVVLGLLPWSLRNAAAGIESRYLGTIMTVNPWRPEEGTIQTVDMMIDKMLINIDVTVIKGFKEILFPFISLNYNESSGVLAYIGGILIVAVMIWGAWNMKSFRWFFLAFFAANIGLFALWHGGNGSRYVVPIAPFIYVLFYVGLYNIVKLFAKDRIKSNTLLLLLILLMVFPPIRAIYIQHKIASMPYLPAYRNYFMIAEQIEKDMEASTVICCRKPELFKYYAPSMRTTNYLYDKDADKVIANLIEKEVDFVVLEYLGYSSTDLYLYPAIQKHRDLFHIAAQVTDPDTYLFFFDIEKARTKLGIN